MARGGRPGSNSSTVQAPQSPSLQPVLEPVRPEKRRNSNRFWWSGADETSTGSPLMVIKADNEASGHPVDVFVIEVRGRDVPDGREPLRTVGCHPDRIPGLDRIIRTLQPIDALAGQHQ